MLWRDLPPTSFQEGAGRGTGFLSTEKLREGDASLLATFKGLDHTMIERTNRAFGDALESPSAILRSRAPLRISFCGGGTDVAPYPERFGGCVLSATISKYAYVSMRRHSDRTIRVVSQDTGVSAVFDPSAEAPLEGKIDVAQAIFRRFETTAVDCYMHSDAPPGSGLGSSSAMIVALITGLVRGGALHLTPYEVADLAYQIERNDLGIVGGQQDQYACSFGGFNFIEFSGDGVYVTPLRLSDDAVAELHYHLLLCYTGKTRVSSNILREQTDNVENEKPEVMQSLTTIKDLTLAMKRNLLLGRLAEFGDLLDQSWRLKKKLASKISDDSIDELYAAAKSEGALGGKILGAGGGGYLLTFVPFNKRERVRARLEALGGRVVDFQFEQRGARAWPVSGNLWS